jgi:hypothetical protein
MWKEREVEEENISSYWMNLKEKRRCWKLDLTLCRTPSGRDF